MREKRIGNAKLKLLDYGTGDGYLFNVLGKDTTNAYINHAYEPVREQFELLVTNVEKNNLAVTCLSVLSETEKYDIIICAEVFEHFSARNVLEHLDILKGCLAESGTLLISVPIETGFSGLLKNLVRAVIGQSHRGSSLGLAIKSFFGLPIYRSGGDGFISSHMGFSHRRLQYLLLDSELVIEKIYYSPVPFLGVLSNSQAFFECRKR